MTATGAIERPLSFAGNDIPGVMLFEIRDGLIARRTDVWDSLTFLRQTGAVQQG